VPSGTATWSSPIDLNKGIAIIGAGIGNTVIADYGFDIANGTDNWRISGFEFHGTGDWCISAGAEKSTDGCRDFRIDHCKFNGEYATVLFFDGHCTGVIDQCDFVGGGNARIMFGTGYDDTAWAEDTGLGSSDFVFIEDCTFTNDGEEITHIVDGSRGAKYVFRYNTVTETPPLNINGWVCMHGYCHGESARGLRAFEVYGNIFKRGLGGYARLFTIRGGTGVIYNNTFDSSVGSWADIFYFRELRIEHNEAISTKCDSNCSESRWCDEGGEGYPCCDQVGRGKNQASEPVYIWNNVDHNGNDISSSTVTTPAVIQENRDYIFTQKTGYTPYAYPHPLADSGSMNPQIAGPAGGSSSCMIDTLGKKVSGFHN
jgi:prepilin-type processing-associated H-X9-DG protein